jgi:hypothetical protein
VAIDGVLAVLFVVGTTCPAHDRDRQGPSLAVVFVLYLAGLRYPRRTSTAVRAGVLAAAGAAALSFGTAGRCGGMLWPPGSSAPVSSNSTVPLQSRLHPCSG